MIRHLAFFVAGVVTFAFASQGLAAQLAHRWSFNGNLKDSVAGKDAVIVDVGPNNAVLSDTEVTMTGGAKGSSDYVDLPDHVLSDLGPDVTFEVWATHLSVQNWSRIFAFGTSTAEHMCMSWSQGTNINTDHVEFFDPDPYTNSRLDNTNAPYELGVKYHIVCVFEPGRMTWYTARADSADLGSAKGSFAISDVSGLNDTNCWLGRSHYDDGTANASYDECRLWKGALSEAEREKLHDQGPDGLRIGAAADPSPSDKATDVPRDVDLGWGAGKYAAAHDLYLGTVRDDVNDASRSDPRGVLVSQGQTATTFDPSYLAYGQTYFWRVDEVNAPPDNTIFKGEVWSFTVEPYAYPITHIIATSNAASEPESGPEKTVDGSGLNAADLHSTVASDMWAGTTGGAEPVWIQYEFDKVYALYELKVWNYNLAFELMFGFGFKDVTIEYSADGTEWTSLGDFQFARGTAKANYAANTVVGLGGVAARFVRLTAKSGYGMMGTYGLSEVRFSYVPIQPREPQPEDGAIDVSVDAILDWRAGRQAASHEVYLSSDEAAVTDGTALVDSVTQSYYDPGTLDLGTEYYWKIVEVNETETVRSWAGDVWSFSTQPFIVVDDFESYTDDLDAHATIFDTWLDGWTNGSGSTVGYFEAPFAEQTVIHGGTQSMPFYYANTGGVTYSEAERTLDPAQDWTRAGAQTLVLYFSGDFDNAAAQLYVKVNGVRVDYSGSAASLRAPGWRQWNIDLASLGNAAKSVKTLAIGVSGAGSGLLFVDDVRLYRVAPATPEPAVDPGSADLVAHYTFENNLRDVTGNGYDGTSPWLLLYGKGPGDYGQAVTFSGQGDYIELPIGSLLPTLTDCTIATLVNFSNNGNAWQRIFDFGSGSSGSYMLLCPSSNTSGPIWFAITTSGGAGESVITGPSPLPTGWHHVAVVIASASMTVQIYIDGEMVAEGPTATLPADLGVTTQNWLGRSQYEVDEYFGGALDDFRIYKRALSAAEVRYLAGDR
ncbi:MAG TPA: discoidin domain-containing protein [Sedimentisphaerales bacterium]|nr:discoidin domain-containing protein [Sedimentisphaerales bacterium]HRS12306.1 discoidin domain-containing protein [Sedimentisphaerales bacterium]HRV48977.1 discoidin domain-containing protein [Sedimentisphaerales bacterium]